VVCGCGNFFIFVKCKQTYIANKDMKCLCLCLQNLHALRQPSSFYSSLDLDVNTDGQGQIDSAFDPDQGCTFY